MGWLQVWLGVAVIGYVGVASVYWVHTEYRLMGIFILYAVTNGIFMTIPGAK